MGGGGATLGSSGAHPAELLSVSGLGRGGHGEDTPVPAWSEEGGLPTAGNRWANPRGSNTPLRKSRTPGTRWPPPAPAPDPCLAPSWDLVSLAPLALTCPTAQVSRQRLSSVGSWPQRPARCFAHRPLPTVSRRLDGVL